MGDIRFCCRTARCFEDAVNILWRDAFSGPDRAQQYPFCSALERHLAADANLFCLSTLLRNNNLPLP